MGVRIFTPLPSLAFSPVNCIFWPGLNKPPSVETIMNHEDNFSGTLLVLLYTTISSVNTCRIVNAVFDIAV